MSPPVTIRPWSPADTPAVIELIVGIQRDELGIAITRDDQPDLADVEGSYLDGGGRFWVAEIDGRIVGTIAAIVIEDNTAVIRKMFVDPAQRGGGLADGLMAELLGWARRAGYRTILLGTTAVMQRAHRFYERHGFAVFDVEALPPEFPRMAVDTVFYRLDLGGVVAIREPDPQWPDRYRRLRAAIVHALGDAVHLVEHVGSTSVPGLAAKPVIDIVITVADSADESAYLPQLESAGYRLVVREPDWFEHRCLQRDWPRANLHVFTDGCTEVDVMIRFRDWLTQHPEDRERYERVKRDLAGRDWDVVQEYADAKSGVVARIKRRAGID